MIQCVAVAPSLLRSASRVTGVWLKPASKFTYRIHSVCLDAITYPNPRFSSGPITPKTVRRLTEVLPQKFESLLRTVIFTREPLTEVQDLHQVILWSCPNTFFPFSWLIASYICLSHSLPWILIYSTGLFSINPWDDFFLSWRNYWLQFLFIFIAKWTVLMTQPDEFGCIKCTV